MLPFFKNKLNLDNIYTHLCYTHTFHSLYSMHTHCVGIPCLIYKKRNPRVCFNTSSIQTAPITARCPQGTSRSAGGCKVSGRIPGYSLVCLKRCTPRHDITTSTALKSHNVHFCTFYPFYFRTAMFSIYMDFRYFSCK